jgi:hypothetical protein
MLLRRSLVGALVIIALSSTAHATVISVSPADGSTGYAKIEAAVAGDEVVIAPGTYSYLVYLQNSGTASQPILIHAQDPQNPPVWDLSSGLVDSAPGDYTAGDRARGCWQVIGSYYQISGLVIENCHAASHDSAGLRYYEGAQGLDLKDIVFRDNDNGLTGGSQDSEATVEFCEFDGNGNLAASTTSPTHNVYVYGGTFTLRFSYLHDPIQGQNLHCRAHDATIEYNWFARAKSYVGDLMTDDDTACTTGPFSQRMTLRGNVIDMGTTQQNNSQIIAVYNDEAYTPLNLSIRAIDNTFVGDGGHAAFVHVANCDGTEMQAEITNNVLYGTSVPVLIDDSTHATVSGANNWMATGTNPQGLSTTVFGADPGFMNLATMDYTLAPTSDCIGGASFVSGAPTLEYFQNEVATRMYRVRTAATDIGAFEHTTTGAGIGPYGTPPPPPPDGGIPPVTDAGSTPPAETGVPRGDASTRVGQQPAGCGCAVGGAAQTEARPYVVALLLAASLACASVRRRKRGPER